MTKVSAKINCFDSPESGPETGPEIGLETGPETGPEMGTGVEKLFSLKISFFFLSLVKK